MVNTFGINMILRFGNFTVISHLGAKLTALRKYLNSLYSINDSQIKNLIFSDKFPVVFGSVFGHMQSVLQQMNLVADVSMFTWKQYSSSKSLR